jgi:hypothetical protein
VSTIVAAVLAAPAGDDALFESFEDGFGAWSVHGSVGCEPDCAFEFSVTPTQQYALDGSWSLEFTANGWHDDGTVWVQQAIHLPPGDWQLDMAFHMFDEGPSDVNNWEVVAAIALEPARTEADFTWVGEAGEAGWTPYAHGAELSVTEPTTAYVAFGYNIVWETVRTHWFDAVTIAGAPPQPPAGDATGDGAVDVDDLIAVITGWGPCGPGPSYCPADLNGDGAVDVDDLLLVLLRWG